MAGKLVIVEPAGMPTVFDPSQTRMMVAGISGAIKQAKAMRNWAAGEQAIEALIDLQAAFVAWWDVTVSPGQSSGANQYRSVAKSQPTISAAGALAQTGIGPPQVSRWRGRLSDRKAYRLALRKALQTVAMSRDPRMEPTGELPLLDRKYRCIIIDPPWPMTKIERVVAPNQTSDEIDFDYPTMSESELADLWGTTIKNLIEDDCHIFMWTTQKFLPMAERLITAWNLRYVLNMVWHRAADFNLSACRNIIANS